MNKNSNVKEIVLKNRSYREFDSSVPITHEVIEEYIDSVRFTPSTVNLQPLKFYIATKPDETSLIRQNVKFAGLLTGYNGPDKEHNPTGYVIIFADKNIAAKPEGFDKDVGIAAQTILLEAAEDGFGGCMIGSFNGNEITRYFKFPENLSMRLIIALGKPLTKIVLEEMPAGGSTAYYRDENSVHHVPKRPLSEILINRNF
ncbi:MAG: nitroreductase [Clostridiales bacterium]|nr:nitroreductase [Clostridiales bacterium]